MAINSFDPSKNGATPFNPKAAGATPVAAPQRPKSSGIGKDIFGILGGTAGQILGSAEPGGGTIAGGAAGGGLGGAVGDIIDQFNAGARPSKAGAKQGLNTIKQGLTAPVQSPLAPRTQAGFLPKILEGVGQAAGLDTGEVARSAGEQGAYGAIPVGNEMRAIPLVGRLAENIGGRAVLRAATGAGGSAVAQEVGTGKVDPAQAAIAGVANAGIPGINKVVGKGTGLVAGYGRAIKKAADKGEAILEKPTQVAIEKIFGPRSVSTGKGGRSIAADVDQVIKEHNIQIPPEDDIRNLQPSLYAASQAVEDQLQPAFKVVADNSSFETIKKIIKDNASILPYEKIKSRYARQIPFPISEKLGTLGNKITVGQIKELQREVGKWGEWQSKNPSATGQFAQKTYHELEDVIKKELEDKPELAPYKDLMNQHSILSEAEARVRNKMHGNAELPTEWTDKEAAIEKFNQLSAQRKKMIIASTIAGLGTGGAALGGTLPLPDPVKSALRALGAGAGVAGGLYLGKEILPAHAPDAASKISKKLINVSQPGKKAGEVERLLQQLGVRF